MADKKSKSIKRIVEQNMLMHHIKTYRRSGSLRAKGVVDNLDFGDEILREHNEKPYKKMLNSLMQSGMALINHATGTGKSYLAVKYLNDGFLDNGRKVLYLVPTNAIIDNFKKRLTECLGKDYDKFLDIEFATYQGADALKGKKYDAIICDEAHRLGASKWRQDVVDVLESNVDADLIGLTATIGRMDGLDITHFFGKPASTITLYDAYEEGILNPPIYYMCELDFKKYSDGPSEIASLIKEYQDRVAKSKNPEEIEEGKKLIELYKKAQRAVPTDEKLPDVIAEVFDDIRQNVETNKNMRLENGRVIVFCPPGMDSETQQRFVDLIYKDSAKWFGGKVKPYMMSSALKTESENMAELKNFENDNSPNLKLMFNVGMLNEGVHIDDLDGVIMLRPTESSPLYIQQLGRLNRASPEKQTWIIDCVSNALNMANGDFQDNARNYIKNVLSQNKTTDDEQETKYGKHATRAEHMPFDIRFLSKQCELAEILKRANVVKENFDGKYRDSAFQQLMYYIIVCREQHPKWVNKKTGKLNVPGSAVITIKDEQTGEKIEYKIGAQVCNYKIKYQKYLRGEKVDSSFTKEQWREFDMQVDTRMGVKTDFVFANLMKAISKTRIEHPEWINKKTGKLNVPTSAVVTIEDEQTGNKIEYNIGRQISTYKLKYQKYLRGEKVVSKFTDEQWEELASQIDTRIGERTDFVFANLMKAISKTRIEHPEWINKKTGKLNVPTSAVVTIEDEQTGNKIEYNIGSQIHNYKRGYQKYLRGEKVDSSFTKEQWEEFALHIDTRGQKDFAFTNLMKAIAKTRIEHPEWVNKKTGKLNVPGSAVITIKDEQTGEKIEYKIGSQIHNYKRGYQKYLRGEKVDSSFTKEQWREFDMQVDTRMGVKTDFVFANLMKAISKTRIEHPKWVSETTGKLNVPKRAVVTIEDEQTGNTIEYNIGRQINTYKVNYRRYLRGEKVDISFTKEQWEEFAGLVDCEKKLTDKQRKQIKNIVEDSGNAERENDTQTEQTNIKNKPNNPTG